MKGSRAVGPAIDALSEHAGRGVRVDRRLQRRDRPHQRLRRAPNSTAGWLNAGIYSDNGGHPGTLLSQGNRGNLTKPGWNTVPIPPVSVVKGQKYWTAIQALGGVLQIRTNSGGAGTGNSETGKTTGAPDAAGQLDDRRRLPGDAPVSAFAPLLTA